MKKFCIFDSKKICDNCGECDKCDLDSNKKCNNCGKCLEMQGIDTKAIKIASVIEDSKEAKEYEEFIKDDSNFDKIDELLKKEEEEMQEESELKPLIEDEYTNSDFEIKDEDSPKDQEIDVEYIEDIDGLKEILESKENLKSVVNEQFPGFFVVNDKKDKKDK